MTIFKAEDKVQRKEALRNHFWTKACRELNIPLDHVFTVENTPRWGISLKGAPELYWISWGGPLS